MKIGARFFTGIIVALICACSTGQERGTVVYVSPDGDNAWTGKLAEPNRNGTDGPFATLDKARDALRALKQKGPLPSGGITVMIRGGEYRMGETLTLTAEDSGTATSPVVWRSYSGEEVTLVGGVEIADFEPVTDPSVLSRIDAAHHENIVKADLSAPGISDFGEMNPRSGKKMELYFKEQFMQIARYPNEGWLTIADVPQFSIEKSPEQRDSDTSSVPRGRHFGRFTYDGDRPNRWKESDDIWMHGYWVYDWSDTFQRAEIIDKKNRVIFPAEPHHHYGYYKGQRYYFLNVLEELDSPGEWFVDKEKGILYFWPPAPVGEGDAYISTMEQVMVSLEETSFLTIRGINFKVSRGSAIKISGGKNTTIAGCTFRNFGSYVIVMDGGTGNGVTGCDIYEVASGGIRFNGGDRKTLTPGDNYATNNHIHHFARMIKTYQSGITMGGVGNRMAHNLIHDSPHMAIGWSGNDHIIELNEIHDAVLETNDAGACYNGRDPSQQGTIIRYNYWHDIGKVLGHGSNAVYFDDALCGNTVFGNVFYRAGIPGRAQMGAVFIHGGRYNVIDNNIFIECERAYGESPWNDETWKKRSEVHDWQRRLYENVDISKPPYTEKYPWLVNIMNDKRPNVLSRNLVYRCANFLGRGKQELFDNLVTSEAPGFVDEEANNFLLKDDSWVYDRIPGFKKIPFNKIGLTIDEYRTALPMNN